jgi:hypothetical protein
MASNRSELLTFRKPMLLLADSNISPSSSEAPEFLTSDRMIIYNTLISVVWFAFKDDGNGMTLASSPW